MSNGFTVYEVSLEASAFVAILAAMTLGEDHSAAMTLGEEE